MKIIKGLFIVMFLLGLAVCAYAIHQTTPAETAAAMPGAHAGQVYDYIMKGNPYTSWELWPGKGRLYKGTEPHGSYLTTYVNPVAYSAASKKRGMSDGAMIVKENYSPEKTLAALTVMFRIKGYNPGAGNWFWAKYDTEGKVLASGKVDACINCHGKNKDNDYIMTGKVKKARAGGY